MRRARVACALVACLAGLPAAAQWKLPDNIAPLFQDGQACNDARTHCIVNAKDWFQHKAASDLLARRIVQLQLELEEERAQRKHCAVVTPSARTTSFRPPTSRPAAPAACAG